MIVSVSVKGPIGQECVVACESVCLFGIRASSFVIRVIEFGYFLPLISIPPFMQFNNLASSFTHYSFVSESFEKLLQTGVIEECRKEQLTVISPLGWYLRKVECLDLFLT